ncbi:hypothetical protein MASR2M17_01280 [Aminivibrio sp.]
MEDAELLIAAYGTTARISRSAVNNLRAEGLKSRNDPPDHPVALSHGCLPGPSDGIRHILVAEMNAGQMIDDVKVATNCRYPVSFYGRTGGFAFGQGDRGRMQAASRPVKEEKTMSEVKIYARPVSWMPDVSSHYCPGCGHGIAHRLVCESIDELGIQNDTIGVASVGCSAMIYDYIDVDYCEAPTEEPPAVATGLKTVRPDKIVFTYQGTVTWPPSAWGRSSTPRTGDRTSPSSS